MQQEKGFIKYIVIIAIILGVVFLSQQPYFRELGKKLFSQGSATAQEYWAKGSTWVSDNVYPMVSGEVQKRGAVISEEVAKEKEKVSETIGEKIKNYFSGVVDSVFSPGKNNSQNNCAPAGTSAETQAKP